MTNVRRQGLAVLILAFPPLSPSAAQESPCDRGLEALARGPHGYALRGDRCEGVYIQQVGGTALWVASLTESFEDYDLTSGADLIIEWAAGGDRPIRLRAQGIKRDLYYRMDAVRPVVSRSYRWPSDVLAAQHITRGDIGLLGWIRQSLGGVDRDVYVPLRIRQHGSAAGSGGYELVLFPTVALKEVHVSLAMVESDGRPERFVQQGEPLRYGYYPAHRPVSIRLRDLGGSGIYYVEIGAEFDAGGSATLTHWIYHEQGPR